MEIREAIQHIANIKSMIASGAKEALTNDDELMMFVNQIYEQASESPLNKTRLINMFGQDVIDTIFQYSLEKSVEQDFLVMNKCIE